MKFFACVFALCVLAFANANRCETPCTREYNPVCGSDGQQFRLFPNACVLKNQHCRDGHNWLQTRMSECPKAFEEEQPCEVPCTREYQPVCGSDGQQFKLFPNACVLKNQHCRDGHKWLQTRMSECPKAFEEDQPCEVPCTREYQPVCGSDGQQFKLFPNACVLKNQHCRDGHKWLQTRMSECPKAFEEDQPCEVPCTREYQPVCGSDGQQFKLFPNACVLKNQHCRDGHKWLQTRMSECPAVEEDQPCEVPCTRELRPVCGSDGQQFKVFPNACVLKNQHCRDGHSWLQTRMDSCSNEDQAHKNCPTICPALYAPVCGFDGKFFKRFPNKCMLDVNNCQYNHHFEVVTLDECA